MSNKQYIFERAYTDNYHVILVENGKIVSSEIISYYNLDGYLSALKNMGYERGYFVPKYKVRLLQAQEELEFAQREYDDAIKHPVNFSEKEIEKYRKIIHWGE